MSAPPGEAPIRFERFSYQYPLQERPILNDLSLQIGAGEFWLVTGESGAGKSTFLRAINGLVPHFYGGQVGGRLLVHGLDTRQVEPRDLSAHVGFVTQDPESQFVVSQVEDELVFAMENFGIPRPEMARRLDAVTAALDIGPLRDRAVETLSGGEKQRVAIAGVLTLEPEILVLDEPTSQLDPEAAGELLRLLLRLNREQGLTILLSEHRLERVLPLVDHLLWLPADGAAPIGGPVREVLPALPLVPPVVQLARRLGWHPTPLSVEAARPLAARLPLPPPIAPPTPVPSTGTLLEVENLSYAYGARPVLQEITFSAAPGEFIAIVGPNGSGKSTLLKLLIALLRPDHGRVRIAGRETTGEPVQQIARRVAYLPQNPNALLFSETVYEELLVTLRNHGLTAERAPIHPRALLARLGLAPFAPAYPRDLSAGQRERVALAAVLVTRPPLILLDEPTRGLDYGQKASLMELVDGWRADGRTILMVTHDVELVAAYAERVLFLEHGRLTASGPVRELLGAHPIFAPQMSRIFARPDLTSVDHVLAAAGVTP